MSSSFSMIARRVRPIAALATFAVMVALLMFWLGGAFHAKIARNARVSDVSVALPAGIPVVEAHLMRLPILESAVGTIQAVHETTIASRILARVVEIELHAGQLVKQGEVLVRLDDSDLQARLRQAKAAEDSAKAEHDQTMSDEKRLAGLIGSNAVSATAYEKAQTMLKTTQADLLRAGESVAEAQAVLAYATIRSPIDGVVVDRKADVGDTASPGQPLVTIYDPHRLQLVASVRESLGRRLRVGQQIQVTLDVLEQNCTGQISEIVPDAQSASRTFLVKVTGNYPAGLYTGMFGRISIPLEDRDVLVIPRSAVRHVGQLELVDVAEDSAVRRRAVRTGQSIGENCEVLSGLRPGEKIVLPSASTTPASDFDDGTRP